MSGRRGRHAHIGDAIGLAHCIVTNLLVIVGYYFDIVAQADPFDGLKIIYAYIDAPVYWLLEDHAGGFWDNYLYTILMGEIVILLSSVLYGFIAYVFARAFIPVDD